MFPENPDRPVSRRAIHIIFILLAVFLCYLPGLDSEFLFDDAPNLGALQYIQDAPVFSDDFRDFVMSGEAGPLGRPVSLFTFALQASSWPDNPIAIKAVNLLIHIFNALLLYLIGCLLAGVIGLDRTRSATLSLIAALVWALHPVHASTVLYTVQRMALLSNFFILLGIYLHLVIRLGKSGNHPRQQILFLSLGLIITGLLALFSKENAPSLVFYLLVLEYTLLKPLPLSPALQKWRLVFLWLPAVATLMLPLLFLGKLQADFSSLFSYTMGERLLTESRVLWDYVAVLLLPTTAATGIFHDVTVSTSLLQPVTTLFSLAAWGVLIVIVILRPGPHRILPFALLWYFSGHLIESTILPLELYFNHRNYLACYGLFFVTVYAFMNRTPDKVLRQHWRVGIISLYLALQGVNTVRGSLLWHDPLRLAESWYEASPGNDRNAEFYAIQLNDMGQPGRRLAANVLYQAVLVNPENFHLLLNLMTVACANPGIRVPDAGDVLLQSADLAPDNRDLVAPMEQLITLHINGSCNSYDDDFFTRLTENLIDQSEGGIKGLLQYNLARLKNYADEGDEARDLLVAAYENAGDAGILFTLALQLINEGRYREALGWIDQAIDTISNTNNIHTGTRSDKLAILQEMRSDAIRFMNEEDSQATQQEEP